MTIVHKLAREGGPGFIVRGVRESFYNKLLATLLLASLLPLIGLALFLGGYFEHRVSERLADAEGLLDSGDMAGAHNALQQATLAMVAPGIAEALIATAMGLFAAIPAVIAYNRYSNDVERLENRYDNFLEEFSSILHRQAHD